MNIGEIMRATLFFTAPNASVAQNVFHYQLTGANATDTEAANSLNSFFLNTWCPDWADLAPQGAFADYWQADIVNPDGTVIRNIATYNLDLEGVAAGEVLPAANAGYLLAYTAEPKQRGSKYLPFISEVMTSNGQFITTSLAALGVMLAHYLASQAVTGGGTLLPGVASKTLLTFLPFLTTGLIDDQPAYQRRRKLAVGS